MIRNNQMLTAYRCAVALIWADGVTITGNNIVKRSDYVSAMTPSRARARWRPSGT